MAIRDCAVIAIDGSHASGKTTLIHALTSHYRERGIHVTCTGEPARTSPFIEEIVIYDRGNFDLETELDLFGAHLTEQLRAARHHTLLIADKTIVNVLTYARVFLPASPGTREARVLDAMENMCEALADLWDIVFCCRDTYSPQQPGDDFRNKVSGYQATIDQMLIDTYARVGIRVIEVPRGLSTAERVSWIAAQLTELGIPAERPRPGTAS